MGQSNMRLTYFTVKWEGPGASEELAVVKSRVLGLGGKGSVLTGSPYDL